jgi:hypothetical protein
MELGVGENYGLREEGRFTMHKIILLQITVHKNKVIFLSIDIII